MPAERFTKKANTPKLRRMWGHVEESAKARGEDPETAVRMASGVVKRQAKKRSKR